MSERELRTSQQVYRLRALGLALGFLCVAAVFHDRGASTAAWAALTAHAFLWPHVAWYRARVSADPNRTERANLVVDSGLGGMWVALMQFSLLPSVLLITMLSMDKLGWGARLLVRTSATMAATCAATVVAAGASFRPSTSMLEIARKGDIEPTLAPCAGVPPVLVDRIEIQQVLVNLIRNAIEAMAGSPATMRRLTIRTETEQDHVRVSVADTGGGVDPAVLDRLFHPFHSTKPTGLGLGLSICQSLVEANGGRIGAGPHPTGGAMFFSRYPWHRRRRPHESASPGLRHRG
jgi:hypothetical protein